MIRLFDDGGGPAGRGAEGRYVEAMVCVLCRRLLDDCTSGMPARVAWRCRLLGVLLFALGDPTGAFFVRTARVPSSDLHIRSVLARSGLTVLVSRFMCRRMVTRGDCVGRRQRMLAGLWPLAADNVRSQSQRKSLVPSHRQGSAEVIARIRSCASAGKRQVRECFRPG
jgi:hypothetical protein